MAKMSNADLIAAIVSATTKLGDSEKQAIQFVMDKNGSSFSDLSSAERREAEEKALKDAEEKKKKEKEEADRKLRESLGENEFLMTEMTGGVLPDSGINHVLFRYPDDTWTDEHKENIPPIDPFFVWDANVLEAVWLAYMTNDNSLLAGPPGTGKTTVCRQLCAWIRQPYARFNGKDGIDASAFLGSVWATKEGMEWRDGLMPQAVANGYLTAIDEIFKLPPGIQMAMQSLYEKNGFLMLDEKPGTIKDKHIHPRPEFRIIGTDNTKGTGDGIDMYAAGQMQDISSLDRFGITCDVGYMKPAVEIGMLEKKYPSVQKAMIKKAVTFANLVRESFLNQGDLSLTMSPRGLSVVCELLSRKVDLKLALNLSYINKLSDDSEIRVARKFVSDAI